MMHCYNCSGLSALSEDVVQQHHVQEHAETKGYSKKTWWNTLVGPLPNLMYVNYMCIKLD